MRLLMAQKAGADAPLHTMELTRYNQRTVQRNPSSPVMTLPDVTIQGACTIEDPEKWAYALTTEIGRHKVYGYGMLLLSSARTIAK